MEKGEGHLRVFNYVTVPNAPTYRAIMAVFAQARRRYVIELRPTEVLEALGGRCAKIDGLPDVGYHLDQLVKWGNLTRRHDTAAVSRIDDFYRRRHVFHLTAAGEAAHRAVEQVEATLGTSGSLQTSMLLRVRDALRELARLARDPATAPPERLARLLDDLHTAFDLLTTEATRFIGELGRHVAGRGAGEVEDSGEVKEVGELDEERFVAYKRAVLAYLGRFVDELRASSGDIADQVRAVQEAGFRALSRRAVSAAEIPPSPDLTGLRQRWIEDRIERWDGVCAWFIGRRGEEPTVERLSSVAIDAVVELTRSLGRLNERRGRAADRAADFTTLARWFAACPSDEEAHAIFHAAFGLHSARHLRLAEEDAELTSPDTSWWDAAAAPVPVRLRTHGTLPRASGPSAAADHSEARRWMAQLQRRERSRRQAALGRFAGRGPIRLSRLGQLKAEELEVFLGLIDEALTSPPSAEGCRQARTDDGGLTIRLASPPPDDRRQVTISAPGGRITCRDYRLEVIERRPEPRRDTEVVPEVAA